MSALSLRLPESLHKRVREIAAREMKAPRGTRLFVSLQKRPKHPLLSWISEAE
jgi:hypothetical protein